MTHHNRRIWTLRIKTKRRGRTVSKWQDTREEPTLTTYKYLGVRLWKFRWKFIVDSHFWIWSDRTTWKQNTNLSWHFLPRSFPNSFPKSEVLDLDSQYVQKIDHQSPSTKKEYLYQIWAPRTDATCAKSDATSLEWPNGSICQPIFGRAHSPNVSRKNSAPKLCWSIIEL